MASMRSVRRWCMKGCFDDPGATVLTRMLWAANSRARCRVRLCTGRPWLNHRCRRPARRRQALRLTPTLMMAPLPRCIRCGAAASRGTDDRAGVEIEDRVEPGGVRFEKGAGSRASPPIDQHIESLQRARQLVHQSRCNPGPSEIAMQERRGATAGLNFAGDGFCARLVGVPVDGRSRACARRTRDYGSPMPELEPVTRHHLPARSSIRTMNAHLGTPAPAEGKRRPRPCDHPSRPSNGLNYIIILRKTRVKMSGDRCLSLRSPLRKPDCSKRVILII